MFSLIRLLFWILIVVTFTFAQRSTQVTSTVKPKVEESNSAKANGNLTFILSGSQVPTKDSNSKVDGFVKVFTSSGGETKEIELGTTEIIDNDDNPKWNKVFWILWKKGSGQKLRFLIKDQEILSPSVEVGQVTVDVDEYVLKKGQDATILIGTSAAKDKTGQPTGGTGFLHVMKTVPTSFRLYARNVPHKDPFNGKSDPFVEIYWRQGKTGKNILMSTSSTIDDSENPDWNETFEFANYQKGIDQYWYFKVLDKDGVGNDFIGDLLVQVDLFVSERKPKISKMENSDGKATLAVTPV